MIILQFILKPIFYKSIIEKLTIIINFVGSEVGHAIVYFVETLCYKPEGSGFAT
jgi:hypothetical protein